MELDSTTPMIRNPSTGLVSGLNEAAAPSVLRRSRVSSDLDDLQLLHEATGWTPSLPLRPSPSMHAQKDFILSNIRQMWRTDADWVSHQIFGVRRPPRASGQKLSAERPKAGLGVLADQPFPYQGIPAGTKHMVFWMATAGEDWTDEKINNGIANAIDDGRGGGEFVWYPNPKPSVTDEVLRHVQVFWRPAGGGAMDAEQVVEAPAVATGEAVGQETEGWTTKMVMAAA